MTFPNVGLKYFNNLTKTDSNSCFYFSSPSVPFLNHAAKKLWLPSRTTLLLIKTNTSPVAYYNIPRITHTPTHQPLKKHKQLSNNPNSSYTRCYYSYSKRTTTTFAFYSKPVSRRGYLERGHWYSSASKMCSSSSSVHTNYTHKRKRLNKERTQTHTVASY